MYSDNIQSIRISIGSRITDLRKKKGLSIPDLAKCISIEKPNGDEKTDKAKEMDLRKIEKPMQYAPYKQSLPDLKVLLQVCNVLGCEIDHLLGKCAETTKPLTDTCHYTGLSPGVVEELHRSHKERLELRDSTLKKSFPDESTSVLPKNVYANPFLEYLILSEHDINNHLFSLVTDERNIQQYGIHKLHLSKSNYDKFRKAFEQAIFSVSLLSKDRIHLMMHLESEHEAIVEYFTKYLQQAFSKRFATIVDLDEWLIKRYEIDHYGICHYLMLEYEQTNRKRIINDEFMMLVESFINGGVTNNDQ